MCLHFQRTAFSAGVPLNMEELPREGSYNVAWMHKGDTKIELRIEAEKVRQGGWRVATPKLVCG